MTADTARRSALAKEFQHVQGECERLARDAQGEILRCETGGHHARPVPHRQGRGDRHVTPYGIQAEATLEALRDIESNGGPLVEVGTASGWGRS